MSLLVRYSDGTESTLAEGAAGGTSTVATATQAEAEAGVDNTKAMTPLRTKQAIVAAASAGAMVSQITTASGWVIKEVSGNLCILFNNVVKFKFDSTGNFSAASDVVGFETL